VNVVTCQTEAARPIWARTHSDTLPLFEAFEIRRLALARDFEAGKLSANAYGAAARNAQSDFRRQLLEHANPGFIAADWSTKPTPEIVQPYYPKEAEKKRIEGSALIHCTITKEGRANDCRVISETPVGYGFGNAAIATTSVMSFRPATKDGVPQEQSPINIPIHFTVPPTWLQKLAGTSKR